MSQAVAGDRAALRGAAPVPGPRAARARTEVVAALESADGAFAAWEAGSASFGRADEASDLDVCVLCADGAADQVLDAIEQRLRAITAELDTWRPPVGRFGQQRFLHPRGEQASLLPQVDISAMELEGQEQLWQAVLIPERHGRALDLFDPDGVLADAMARTRFDADTHRSLIVTELETIRARQALFGSFPAKELDRDRTLDAYGFHQALVLSPLVTLLSMRHRPLRFDYGWRYLHEELPADVVECLVALVQPPIADPLPRALEAGLAWIDRLLAALDPATLPIEEHAQQMRSTFGPA